MELVVEMPTLTGEWYADLSQRLADNPALAGIEFSQVQLPPGSMGADHIPRLKASWVEAAAKVGVNLAAIVADVAAVVAVAVSFHGSGPAPAEICDVSLTRGPETVTMTVPCDKGTSQEFVTTVSQFIAQSSDGTLKVRVTPSVEPAGS
jgi:hypothetical protein